MTQVAGMFANRYLIEGPIARGGMADVFLARDQILDRPVAVKVLFPEYARDPNFVERFRREAQSAASLNHPNIVGVFDWGQEHGTYFIVMEYVEGQSLRDILRADHALPVMQAAGIAAEIADALGFAHRHGVVHRDVKPGNVLITPTGQVKVTDFGIAANPTEPASGLTQTGAVMGTATYFSPEQAQGFPVDGRTDVYALGVVLYEMVTGAAPFHADTPVAVAMKHVRELPVPPSQHVLDLPPDLERIILAAMAKDVHARYQSADAMRDDLIRFERGRPVVAAYAPAGNEATVFGSAGAPTEAAQLWEPRPRRWPAIVATTLGLALLAAVLVVLLVPSLRQQVIGDTKQIPQIDIPDVTTGNPTFDQAQARLIGAGFKVVRVDIEADAVQPGRVVKQTPPAGQLLEKGKPITLLVANNVVTVPALAGQPIEQATPVLAALGLSIQRVDTPTATAAPGVILSTNPAAGAKSTRGAAISVMVAQTPKVAVPTLQGQDQVAASNQLQAAGFQVQIVPQNNAGVPAGKVIGTDPPAGTMANKGDTIKLLVSTGPQTVMVPQVVGMGAQQATSTLTGAGLSVAVTCGSPTSVVITENPPGGSTVNPGSAVAIACAA